MKKFFGKYDLIKVSGIMVLLSVILTWLIPYGYFAESGMVTEEITRLGFQDFCQYGLLGMYYFTVLVTFLFVLGGFYQVLSKRPGYQRLIKNISDKLKGREIIFVLLVCLLFAIIGSTVNEYFPFLAFIPFIIAILNRLKVDKISSFVATFGGLLVGTLGSTYSTKVTGQLLNTFALKNSDVIVTELIIFALSYLLLAVFTFLRMRKLKGDKKAESYDRFEVEVAETKKAPKTWPYIIGIILFIVVTVLAYLPWSTWEVELFTDITTWVNEFTIADIPIFNYIFSKFTAFGTWDIFSIQFVMIFITLLIHWFGKMSLDEMLECYGEGFKKIGNVVIVLLVVYTILILAVMFPVVPVIVDWFMNLVSGFNSIMAFIAAAFTSCFGVEMQYVMSLAGTYFASTFAEGTSMELLTIIFQSAWGLISFIIPSSAILMIGLSYLDIKYKDWWKFIWKFLLAMLVILIIIILIIA